MKIEIGSQDRLQLLKNINLNSDLYFLVSSCENLGKLLNFPASPIFWESTHQIMSVILMMIKWDKQVKILA